MEIAVKTELLLCQLWTLHLNSSYLSMSCTDGVKSPHIPAGEFCSIRYKGILLSLGETLLSPEKGKLTGKSGIINPEFLKPVCKQFMEGILAAFIYFCSGVSEKKMEIYRDEIVGWPKASEFANWQTWAWNTGLLILGLLFPIIPPLGIFIVTIVLLLLLLLLYVCG